MIVYVFKNQVIPQNMIYSIVAEDEFAAIAEIGDSDFILDFEVPYYFIDMEKLHSPRPFIKGYCYLEIKNTMQIVHTDIPVLT